MESQPITIPGLYDAAYRAHSGTSFSPEKRAASYVTECETELNDDLKDIPEDEKERYIENYKKYLFSWMSAKSRCFSSMITGPSNFPVRRMEKLNGYEHNRMVEFIEWRKKALASIAQRKEANKPQDQKDAERWLKIKKGLESSIITIISIDKGQSHYTRSLFVSSITNAIKTMANNGQVDDVKKSLDLITYWNGIADKPVITAKNSVWSLIQAAEAVIELEVDKQTAENKEYQISGVDVIENIQADRIQLFFDGKPIPETIAQLKRNAFRWSPSNGCWQRQLTSNAIWATKNLLSSL
ncbi:MAG TPA: hypothetical protein DCL77_14285 [Prolixibacteraceae bacterium]|jgi:hypothetical protein|nr:hypothetical protein [Prolixibacteraceae bacterium]